jgi:hypothetical protein
MRKGSAILLCGLLALGVTGMGCDDHEQNGSPVHPAVGSWVLLGSLWTADPNDEETLTIAESEGGHVFRWEIGGAIYQAGTMVFNDSVYPHRIFVDILTGEGAGELHPCIIYKIEDTVMTIVQDASEDCTIPLDFDPDSGQDLLLFDRL